MAPALSARTGVLRAHPLFGSTWSDPLPVGWLSTARSDGKIDGLSGRVAIRYRGVRRAGGDHREPVYRVTYTPPPPPGQPPRSDWSYCAPGGRCS